MNAKASSVPVVEIIFRSWIRPYKTGFLQGPPLLDGSAVHQRKWQFNFSHFCGTYGRVAARVFPQGPR